MNRKQTEIIAFHLPQFHPIPENDEWWGKGFTEWTNVTKAKKLFLGHEQPIYPGDLSYYDLRVPEVREVQAEMAKKFGVTGFCYWHYWFNGRRILERPVEEILESEEPDFPFCLAWANETWSGIWHGNPKKILIEQTYPGEEDYINHFYEVLKYFRDRRYIKVDNKPLFAIYHPENIPSLEMMVKLWRNLAKKEGLEGIHLVGINSCYTKIKWTPEELGLDATIQTNLAVAIGENNKKIGVRIKRVFRKILGYPQQIYSYNDILPYLITENDKKENYYPCILPNWDNSPRSGKRAVIIKNSSPDLFEKNIEMAFESLKNKKNNIIFLKSWNEWAEGNYVEPDRKNGYGYLEVIRKVKEKYDK